MMPVRSRRQDGFSTIELMISITVIAIGSISVTSGILTTTQSAVTLEEDQLLRDQAQEIAAQMADLRFGNDDTAPTTGQIIDVLAPGTLDTNDLTDEGITLSSSGPGAVLTQFATLGTFAWQYDDADVDEGTIANTESSGGFWAWLSGGFGASSAGTPANVDEQRRAKRKRKKLMKHKKRRRAATKSPWRVGVSADLDGNGVVAGTNETSGNALAIEVWFGGRLMHRVIRSRDPEEM